METQIPPAHPPPKGKPVVAPPWTPSSSLWVLLVDTDAVASYDFGPAGRVPTAHFWEGSDSKMLACETRPGYGTPAAAAAAAGNPFSPSLEATTLFCTLEAELRMQNSLACDEQTSGLIAVRVPNLYFVSTPSADGSPANFDHGAASPSKEADLADAACHAVPKLRVEVMRDFIGMEDVDEATRVALVEFSYHLTMGSMDEAHRAVKLVKNATVWENMAKMCVKTKRLDVAVICLGNMGHARGARAVREVIAEHTAPDGTVAEPDVCAAVLAMQLGLHTEAEQLYQGCNRPDLLNELYQASGQWEQALAIAADKDRIHLKATHYAYARCLEAEGKTQEAITHFEASGTHRVEVPRMLFDAQQMAELNTYIDGQNDKELLKWWAQYAESNARFKEALQYYERAGDQLAIVRILCFHNKMERAAEVVNTSGDLGADLGAAYHLAKQYESKEMVKEAIYYFQQAHRFNHAVRLAKQYDLASELNVAVADDAPPKQLVEAAEYFEAQGQAERAVALYQKGGNVGKAVELCFRMRLFDQLRSIADSLGSDAEPALISRCAEFFLDHGQYEKTVQSISHFT